MLALNPDTRVTQGALSRLIGLMEGAPEIGMAGCRLQLEDGSLDHAAKRSFPTPVSALGHFTGIGRRAGANGRIAAYRATEVELGPVDAINGAFMMMRRRALDEVGLFDQGYWMYMEDLDLCYRFKQAGWTIWYEPSATVVHIKAGTSWQAPEPKAELRVPLRNVALLSHALRERSPRLLQRGHLCRDRPQVARIRHQNGNTAKVAHPHYRLAMTHGSV